MIPDFLAVLCTYCHHRQNAVAGCKIKHCVYKHNKIKHFMQEDNLCNAFIIKVFPCNFYKQNRIWKLLSWFVLWSFTYLICSSEDLKHVSQSFYSLTQREKQHCINILHQHFILLFLQISLFISDLQKKKCLQTTSCLICFTSQLLLLYKWSCLETAWQHVTLHHQNPASLSHVFSTISASSSVAICHVLQKSRSQALRTCTY